MKWGLKVLSLSFHKFFICLFFFLIVLLISFIPFPIYFQNSLASSLSLWRLHHRVVLFRTGGWGTCFAFLDCCLVLHHLSPSGVSLDFQNLSVRLFELLTKTSKLAKLVSKFSVRKRRFKSPGLCVCSMTATNFYSSLKAEYTPGAQLHRRSGEWLLFFTCFILHDQSVFKKCVAQKAHRKRATLCIL